MNAVSADRSEQTIVILGAGCAGLAAGLRLSRRGIPVVLIERAGEVGGLAGGIRLNANTYEYGPHMFHSTDPQILADVKSLMGDLLVPYRRTIKIKFMNSYFDFPLALWDVLLKLHPLTVFHAGLSFLWHAGLGLIRRPEIETSETVLRRCYGDVLYELFFKNYIAAVWGITPAEFSPAFARERIPRMNILGALGKMRLRPGGRRLRAQKTEGFVEKTEGDLYTTDLGFSLITQRMADAVREHGGRVELDATVTAVRREGNRATSVVYTQGGATREIRCAGVINTLPINEAVLMIEPGFGDTVERAARSLRFRSVVFVGLLVRRDRVLPSSFMYYRQHSFNRICDLAQFGFRIRPDGCTQLVAEISCDEGDRAWTDEEFAKEAVLADLVAEGLLTRAEVIETHVFRAEHAYPIYALGYEQSLAALLRAVGTLANMDTAGRQGRFQYVNAHIAMRMGYEAADRLAGERGGGARLRTVAHPRITTRNRDGTDNGFLVPIYNVHDRFVDERHHPEQVYLTVCKPGEQKGPHLHLRRWGYFTCIKGDVRIVARVNGSYVSEFSGENHEFRTIEVPAGVAATIQNIGLEDAYVLNTPSPAWRRDDQDEHDVKGWDWVSE